MKLKTWHYEHVVIATVLAIVWIATGHQERELVGSLAVYLGHGCASIGARMEEQEALRDKPSVPCFRSYWTYYVGKEIAWFVYFVWSGAWSALVGCVLFGLYPFWRKYWRKIHPLKREIDAERTIEYASKSKIRIKPSKFKTNVKTSKLPEEEKNRVFKFNGGRGAVLCSRCNVIVCEDLGPYDTAKDARTIHREPIVKRGMVFCCLRHV